MLEDSVILGKRLLVITAHPDDESFLAGGTIYENNNAGGETNLICATLGEKGASHLTTPLSEEELREVRYKELQKCCSILNVHKVFELDYPDGRVHEYKTELESELTEKVKDIDPEVIISFGPDGITGHKDHIAVGLVVSKISENLKIPLATFCIPHEVSMEAQEWLKNRRKTIDHYESNYETLKENLSLEINSDIKLKALKCYESQIDESNPFAGFPDHIAQTLLKKECFCYTNPLQP